MIDSLKSGHTAKIRIRTMPLDRQEKSSRGAVARSIWPVTGSWAAGGCVVRYGRSTGNLDAISNVFFSSSNSSAGTLAMIFRRRAEFPKTAFVYGRRVNFTVSQEGGQWIAFGQFDGQELRIDDVAGPNAAVSLWLNEARRIWRQRQEAGKIS
jgi:hypothetical protein